MCSVSPVHVLCLGMVIYTILFLVGVENGVYKGVERLIYVVSRRVIYFFIYFVYYFYLFIFLAFSGRGCPYFLLYRDGRSPMHRLGGHLIKNVLRKEKQSVRALLFHRFFTKF